MRGVNKVVLVGNVGTEPSAKRTDKGVPICKFRLATTEIFGVGEEKEHTEWHTIIAWGKLGEICERHLSKGQRVYIDGRIRMTQWTTTDGQKRSAVEIRADDIVFLSLPETTKSLPF